MDYIKSEGFGGAMVWAIDLDDFTGVCGSKKNPLLTVMYDKLKEHSVVIPDPSKLTTTAKPGNQWWPPSSTTKRVSITSSMGTTKTPNISSSPKKPLVTSEATKTTTTSSTTISSTTTSSTEIDETITTEATPDSIVEKCAQPGVQFVPHSDCSLYYWCVHERPILQRCPKDTVWDQNAMKCEWNYNKKDSDKCKAI